MIPTLIMFIGIPGSGKSRWLHDHKPDNCIVLCPDTIRGQLSGDISDQTLNIEVWKQTSEITIRFLKNGTTVILDATNVNTMFRNDFISKLPECKLMAKVFEVKPDIAFKRIQRAIESGEERSNVPEYVVYRMYGEFLYTKKVLKSEGFEVEIIG